MSEVENTYWTHHCQCSSCEEYRDQNQRKWDVAIIKSFVERVEKREIPPWTAEGVIALMHQELAAMEKDNAGTGTND